MKILLLLLALPAYGQISKGQQVENVSDFFGGLNTAYPSSIIQPNQTQDAKNVFFDNGYLEKRGGSRKRNPNAIGGGADVNNFFEYKKADGTDYCVAFSSTNGYYSTDGCASFTSFMSSFTAGNDFNCVPFTDRLYCVNGVDTSFYLSGTSYVAVSAIPVGKYIRAYQNRLWIAGVSAQKSYVYFSAVGNGNSWNTTFDWVGFNPEDGDTITGIGESIFETLPVYKKYSSWVVQNNSADNYTPVVVNTSIGASHHRAIKNFLLKNSKTLQLFSSDGSRGSEPGIYSFNGIVVEYLSDRIRNQIRDLDTFNALARYKQWTSAADWATGTSVFISTSQDLGVIEGQRFSTTTTSAADWEEGDLTSVTTTYLDGALTSYVNRSSTSYDTFSDGDYTASPVWTFSQGVNKFSVVGGSLVYRNTTNSDTSGSLYSSTGTFNFGNWQIGMQAGNTYNPSNPTGAIYSKTKSNYYLYSSSSSTSALTGVAVSLDCKDSFDFCTYRIINIASGTHTTIAYKTKSASVIGSIKFTSLSCPDLKINISDSGAITTTDSSGDCSLSSSIPGFSKSFSLFNLLLADNYYNGWSASSPVDNSFDNIYITGGFSHSGTYISKVYDTALSTTIGGPFTVTDSTSAGEYIWYYVRESTKNVSPSVEAGVWSAFTATSDTLRIPLTKRYWNYKANFQTDYSTHSPVLYDVTLNAVSTGTWTSPETLLDAQISSWGLFQTSELNSGTGSWSYEMRSSTYAGGTASASFSAVTNNTLIGISTGAYIQVRATNSVYTSTDDAKVDEITVNYNVGAQAKSAVAEVYKNRYYWFAQSQNGSNNDVAYVMDSNGAWTKLTGIHARSAAIINGDLYTGASTTTGAGFIYQQDIGSDDNGLAINSYWKSKDYLLGSDDFLKVVDKLYITYPNYNATLGVQLNADGAEATSWNVELSTSSTFGVKALSSGTSSGSKRGKYFNVKLSNNSTDNWRVMGYRMYWTPLQVLSP